MEFVQGWVLCPKGFIKGHLEYEDGRITAINEGERDGSPEAKGVIIPPIPNGHTHIGDTGLRSILPRGRSVEELVGPPDGFKHKQIRDKDLVVEGMKTAMSELAKFGGRDFIDFREGGLEGVGLFQKALSEDGKGLSPRIMGRPEGLKYDEAEVDALLEKAHGIGISSISDWPWDDLKALADHVNSKGRPFALHASEAVREDIRKLLELKPQYVVHMIRAVREDLEALVEADIPVVVCPRANLYFKRLPSINQMLDHGLTVCIGTDNGMFGEISVLDELAIVCKSTGVRPQQAMEMVKNTWAMFHGDKAMCLEVGAPADFIVVKVPAEGVGSAPVRDPEEYITRRAVSEDVSLVSLGGITIKN